MRDNFREYRPRGPGRASTGAESSTRHQPEPTRRRTQPTTEDPYLRRGNSLNSIHSWLGDQSDHDNQSIQRTSSPIQEDYQYQEPKYEARLATSRSQYRSTRHDGPVEDVRVYDQYPQPEPEHESEGPPSSVRYTPPSSPDTAIRERKPSVADRRPKYELDDWHHEQVLEPSDYDPRDGGRREQNSRDKDSYYDDQGSRTYDNGVEVFHEPCQPDETQYDERPRHPRRASAPDEMDPVGGYDSDYRANHDPPAPVRKSRHSINSVDAGLTPSRRSPVDDRRHEYHDTHERNSKGSRDSRQTYDQAPTKYSKQDLGHEDDIRGSRYGVPTPPRTPVNQRDCYDREESPSRDDYQRRRGDYSPPQSVSSYESHGSDHRAPARRTDDYDRPQASTRGAYESGRGDISPPVSYTSIYYDVPEQRRQSHEDYERSRSPSRRDREGTRLRDRRADDRSPPGSSHDTDSSIESIKPRRSKRRSRGRSFAIVQLSSSGSESESELEVKDDSRERKYVGPPIRERDLYPTELARSQRRSGGSREASGNSLFNMARSIIGSRGGSAVFVSLGRSSEAH